MDRPLKVETEGQPAGRLSGVTSIEVLNSDAPDLNDPALKAELQTEMEKAWESDWSNLSLDPD